MWWTPYLKNLQSAWTCYRKKIKDWKAEGKTETLIKDRRENGKKKENKTNKQTKNRRDSERIAQLSDSSDVI